MMMKNKTTQLIMVLTMMVFAFGCGQKTTKEKAVAEQPEVKEMIVEAACGECQFELAGEGCDLAVRIGGKAYFVDGATMDDHGDAHADDGLCNTIREAKVKGHIENDRFVAESFELLAPADHEVHSHEGHEH